MILNFKVFVLVLAICSVNIFGQVWKSIEKESANYFLTLNNHSKSKIEFEKLKSALQAEIDSNEFENKYKVSRHDFNSLINHFSLLESEAENISADSALFLFNQWYLQLSNTFYDCQKEKFFSSPKTKILLFSASMSCYCTLEMCKNQTIDILNFSKENNDKYDYWVVDSYEHNEMQKKYETYFAPSVLVFNSNNEVLHKIEYKEKMIEILAELLNGIKDNK